jgi:hypothetical protein
MTITEIATQLFTDFSPEERSVPDSVTYPGRNAAVKLAMNSALQECFGEGGAWLRYDEKGAIVNAPTAVTIAVTNGSATGTITGWAAWMAGCTIQIEGSAVDNQIRNASATATLKYPYDGTTGSKSATVYHNSIVVPDSVMRVLDPVQFNRILLSAMVHPDMTFVPRLDEDFGHEYRYHNIPDPLRVNETTGHPVGYSVTTWSASDTAQPGTRIRIVPASAEAGVLDYRAMLAPPVVTDLASTDTLPIPQQFVQSIFYPIARKHLSGCPFFRASSSAEEIARAYQEARRLLDKLHPGRNQGRRTRSVY